MSGTSGNRSVDVPSEWRMGVSKEYPRKGLDGDGWMNESAQSAEAAEWMLDGYFDPEDEADAPSGTMA